MLYMYSTRCKFTNSVFFSIFSDVYLRIVYFAKLDGFFTETSNLHISQNADE